MQRKTEKSLYDAAEDAFTSEGGGSVPAAPLERQRAMAEFSIRRDGLRYEYRGYRYDLLSDAVGYARLLRSRSPQDDAGRVLTQAIAAPIQAPTDAERKLMASLAIGFEAGTYRFENYRYERLADAVNYATLAAKRQAEAGR
jgi:hypothetical protein